MHRALVAAICFVVLSSCEQSRQKNASKPPAAQANQMQPSYPHAVDRDKVGEYPALAHAGGGFVWDEVLEYRVWCHPENGAADELDGEDYFYPFATYAEAKEFSEATKGAEEPLQGIYI